MTKTRVQMMRQGQYLLTIPRPIALAMGLKKFDYVTWKITSAKTLELTLP